MRRSRRPLRAVAGPSAAEAAAEERLAAWCSQNGVWQGSAALAVTHFPIPGGGAYRGLRATRDVVPGEMVAAIPLALCIHSQTAADWPHAGATPTARLAARLLQEEALGATSHIAPWLAVLPRSVAGSTFLGDSPPESELLDDTWLLNDFLWDPVAMARGPPRARACAESDSHC